jgi:hypothetical protein
VDAGYGAPFLAPVPLDLERDHEIALGADRFVLKPPDGEGRSTIELHRDGKHVHGYRMNPEPRRIEEFAESLAASFAPEATFMNAVLVARFSPGRGLLLHNRNVIESTGTSSHVTPIADQANVPEVAEERFGIPAGIVREAMAGMELKGGPWG